MGDYSMYDPAQEVAKLNAAEAHVKALREENARLRQRVEELEREVEEHFKEASHHADLQLAAEAEVKRRGDALEMYEREVQGLQEYKRRAEAAEAKLAKVAGLHKPNCDPALIVQATCLECDRNWPCATVAAAKGE